MIPRAGTAVAEGPVVVAHRGASGYLPEHTLEAKAYAHALGADYLEQDVVLTRDDVPVVLHDTWLDPVTDVAALFPGRQRADHRHHAIDFDLDEIRRLTVHERRDRAGRRRWPRRFDAPGVRFRVPALAEEIAFVQGLNRSTGRAAGLYPEIKQPAWHRAQGRDISRTVLRVLGEADLTRRSDPVLLQCFDADELRRVREELGSELRLVQLLGGESWLATPDRRTRELGRIASYADGVGVTLAALFAPRQEAAHFASSGLAEEAHARGLFVHAYTYRDDELPPGVADAAELHRLLFDVAGIDGLFSDHPDVSLRERERRDLAANPGVQ